MEKLHLRTPHFLPSCACIIGLFAASSAFSTKDPAAVYGGRPRWHSESSLLSSPDHDIVLSAAHPRARGVQVPLVEYQCIMRIRVYRQRIRVAAAFTSIEAYSSVCGAPTCPWRAGAPRRISMYHAYQIVSAACTSSSSVHEYRSV